MDILTVCISTLILHPIAWKVFVCRGKIPRLNSAILGLTFESPLLAFYALELHTLGILSIVGFMMVIAVVLAFSTIKRYDNLSLAILWFILALQSVGVSLIS